MDGTASSTDVSRAPFRFQDGVLYIKGTAGEDSLLPVVSRGRLSFELTTLNTYRSSQWVRAMALQGYDPTEGPLPKLGDIRKIVIDAGAGNDKIDLSSLAIPSEVYGGDGRDIIVGSQANDTLVGNNGGDEISDGAGDDLLVGGAGADTLRSGRGQDSLFGLAGPDYLYSSSAEDWINGGEGDDTGMLRRAADEVQSIEKWEQQRVGYEPTTAGSAYGTVLRLRRDSEGQLWLDVTLLLSSGGWDIDWDLMGSGNKVVVKANTYRSNGDYLPALAATSRSFKVDPVGRSSRIDVRVEGRSGTLARGRFDVHPAFESKTIQTGPDVVTSDATQDASALPLSNRLDTPLRSLYAQLLAHLAQGGTPADFVFSNAGMATLERSVVVTIVGESPATLDKAVAKSGGTIRYRVSDQVVEAAIPMAGLGVLDTFGSIVSVQSQQMAIHVA